jgi:polyhydroxyalkanoate synthesis regulator phasin
MALSTTGIVYAVAAPDDDKAVQTTQKAPAKEAPDPVTLALKAAVRNGSMSEAHAIGVYSLLTDGLPGSSKQGQVEAYVDQAAVKLDALVMSGELSAEDAEAKLIALEHQIARKQELALELESGGGPETEAYLDQAAAKLDTLVMKGELSAEDAESKLVALEQQIAVKEEFASRMEIAGKSKTEAYLELVAAELDALVKSGELSADDAEAKMIAVANAVDVAAKPASRDARTVLRAVKRVDLTRSQKDEIRDIERAAIGVYRQISRKDQQGHTELAEQVKGEITELLDREQIEQFQAALKHLNRGAERERRERGRQLDRKPREP